MVKKKYVAAGALMTVAVIGVLLLCSASAKAGKLVVVPDSLIDKVVTCHDLVAGDNVRVFDMDEPAIWNIGSDNRLRPYLSGDDFKSWNSDDKYEWHYKFITSDCLSSLQVARSFPLYVNRRPGSSLIRLKGTTQLYVILPNNTKATITEEAAKALYGVNYPVADLEFASFVNYYNSGQAISGSNPKPHPGMVIRTTEDSQLYYVDNDYSLLPLSGYGFVWNRYKGAYARSFSLKHLQELGLKSGSLLVNTKQKFMTDQAQLIKSSGFSL